MLYQRSVWFQICNTLFNEKMGEVREQVQCGKAKKSPPKKWPQFLKYCDFFDDFFTTIIH